MPEYTFDSYCATIKPFFETVDNSEAIKEVEKQLTASMIRVFKKLEFLSVVDSMGEFGESSGLKTLFEKKTLEHSDIAPLNSFRALRDGFTNKLSNLNRSISKYHNQILAVSQNNGRFASMHIDIEEEFKTLNNLAPFTALNGLSAWKLPTFTLTDVANNVKPIEFPGLYAFMNFNQENLRQGIMITPNKEEALYETDRGNFFHPHVNQNGQICFGDGEETANRLWRRKKIVPLVQLVINILSSYNAASPYMRLATWTRLKRYTCENCGDSVDENNVRFVDEDPNLPACPQCTIIANRTVKWKYDYVQSLFHNKWILKQNATKALNQNNNWDYFENILSLPDFTSCASCFTMVHMAQTTNKNGMTQCKSCERKTT